jgi:FMN phosphatase YigB (HAD superfamily)
LSGAAGFASVRVVIANLELTERPDALLLDAGDTLIFFDPAAVAAALADVGVRVAQPALAAAAHPAKREYQALLARGQSHEDGWTVLMREVLVRAGLSAPHALELLPGLRRVHDDFYFWRKVPERLPDALVRARAEGLRLGVVSNSEGRLLSVLQRVGLAPFFEVVIDSHLEGVHKPNPEIFRRALARLGVDPARALYAGDIPEVDVLGARAAGMAGVVVDAFDDYAGTDWPRVRSVEALIERLLALPF